MQNMYCGEWSLVKGESAQTTIIPLRCHCWTCKECSPLRKANLIAEAQQGAPQIFLTLTSINPGYGSPALAAQQLVRAWREVRRRWCRKNGVKSMPFLCVFEQTKRGWPHLHIVARAKWISQKWLSETMEALTGAKIVDVRSIHGKKSVAFYIAKYIAKNPYRFPGTKRYWRSQDYLLPSTEERQLFERQKIGWIVIREHWREHARLLSRASWDVTYKTNEAIVIHLFPP